jgi:hypothetical protein
MGLAASITERERIQRGGFGKEERHEGNGNCIPAEYVSVLAFHCCEKYLT